MAGERILVIEDQPLNLELTVDLLSLAGYFVITAVDAEKGIELAKAELPDLILMDIGLPGMDGLEATRVLKGDPLTGHIPVVALTSHAMKGDDKKAVAAGCSGYIPKPIDTRKFPVQVAQFIIQAKEGRK